MVDNRSEILFLYDAVDCNPNGNPESSNNEPRMDRETKAAIVTDVRLKRYIRDQLQDEGFDIFVRESMKDGDLLTRAGLFIDQLSEEMESLLKDVFEEEEPVEKLEDIMNYFLDNSIDVRYFGATMSLKDFEGLSDDSLDIDMPSYTGPVQFSPARSLNSPVKKNNNYNSLTSVLPTDKSKSQGGFNLDDERIKYGLFPFYGVVNENSAEETNLSSEDVELLDSVIWRSINNQTHTRSKIGQSPRLYMRVEYEGDKDQIGMLNHYIELDESRSESPETMRNITDVCVDVSDLVDVLNSKSNVKRVKLKVDDLVDMSYNGEEVNNLEELIDHDVEKVDVN